LNELTDVASSTDDGSTYIPSINDPLGKGMFPDVQSIILITSI